MLFKPNFMSTLDTIISPELTISRFFASVYRWMTGALLISGLVAWATANSPGFIGYLMQHSGLFLLIIIAQFACVIALAGWAQRMSFVAAVVTFLMYSALTGLTFSTIFLIYTASSILEVFLVTAGMFAAMSIYGYVTKRDLTSWGSFFFLALIGMILAMLVNFWLHSYAIEWITSVGGVIIFAGLAAYDHQKLKAFAMMGGAGNLAVFGALTLYLDFINLFLSLLRLMGQQRR